MALHVEIGLLLSGKAGVGQVLGRRAAADGHIGGVKLMPTKSVVGGGYIPLQVPGQLCCQNGMTKLATALAQILNVAGVQVAQKVANLLVQLRLAQGTCLGVVGWIGVRLANSSV